MNQSQKQALADMFRAPPPLRKAAFLKQYRRRELGQGELIFIAAGYIPWWVWALSLLLCALMLAAAAWAAELKQPAPGAWYAAALTPFLALLAITENGRAQFYGMEELELACRVSRRSVVLARMAILGLFHLLLLGVLTPVLAARGVTGAAGTMDAVGAVRAVNAAGAGAMNAAGASGALGVLSAARAGVYLLVPYLLTAALGMELARRFRSREGLLACAAAAVLVCGMGSAMPQLRPALYRPEALPLWTAALAGALGLAAAEFCFNSKAMGELR